MKTENVRRLWQLVLARIAHRPLVTRRVSEDGRPTYLANASGYLLGALSRTSGAGAQCGLDGAFHAGVNQRRYRDQFEVDELFDEIADISDAKAVASLALNRLCRSESGYNNNAVGVKAVMRFLSELCSQQPESDSDVGDCLLDLKKTLNGESASAEEIGRWIDRWYQF